MKDFIGLYKVFSVVFGGGMNLKALNSLKVFLRSLVEAIMLNPIKHVNIFPLMNFGFWLIFVSSSLQFDKGEYIN